MLMYGGRAEHDYEGKAEDAPGDRTGERPEAEGMEGGQGGMKLTDQEAIKALKKVRILELDEMLHDYPEDEVDGRSDWEMIANEAGWLLELFLEGDTSHADDLRDAREILSRTRYGKVTPLNPRTLKPIYSKTDVQCAKDTVNEYNRLVRFVGKLRKMGLPIGG